VSCRDLFLRVECYVSLRRALGYVVTSEEKLLKDFVRFVEAQMVTGPIRAQIALDGPLCLRRDVDLRDRRRQGA
jgi:hypothetical protein